MTSSQIRYRQSRAICRAFYNQAKNAAKACLSLPVQCAELSSGTLDADDVQIARQWLLQPDVWNDEKIEQSFQEAFRQWNHARYAFGFAQARESLVAVVHALGLKPGDEILMAGYTCIVVPNVLEALGLKIRYCDIELETYGADVHSLKTCISPDTRAILLQHLYGLVCRDYEAILDLARSKHILVIEDCAQATGAMYKGDRVGNRGDIAFYSCEQTKILNTVKGGLVTTNSDAVGERLAHFHRAAAPTPRAWIEKQLYTMILNYYQFKHAQRFVLGDIFEIAYGHQRLAPYQSWDFDGKIPPDFGRKMAAPIAALGLNQLAKVETYNEQRRQTAKQWDAWCEKNKYNKPVIIRESIPVFLRYPVLVDPAKKKNTRWAREELKINLGDWYRTQLHPVPRQVPHCPNALIAAERCVNLPCLCY